MKFKVFLTPSGEVRGVYHDFFRRLDLEPLQISRASNVEFNPAFQKWEASWPDGTVFCSAADREVCLQLERVHVEERIKMMLTSTSNVGSTASR